MSEQHKIVKICAIALAIVIISLLLDAVLSIAKDISGSNKTDSFIYKYENINELKIDTSTSKVILKEGDEFIVSVDNAPKRLKVIEDNKVLKIKDNSLKIFSKKPSVITITIPSTLEKIDVEIGTGTLECSNIVANNVKLELGAGKVKLSEIYFNASTIEGGAGEISIDNSTLNNLKLDAGTGKVTIDGKITGDSKIDSGIGEINLNLIGNDYDFDLDKGIGKITINGNESSNEVKLGTGENKIKIDAGIGNITINTNK